MEESSTKTPFTVISSVAIGVSQNPLVVWKKALRGAGVPSRNGPPGYSPDHVKTKSQTDTLAVPPSHHFMNRRLAVEITCEESTRVRHDP